jgi:hypothetical protein
LFCFKAQEKLKKIQGVIVEYPLYFLDDENYLPSFRTPEGENFILIIRNDLKQLKIR